MSINADTELHLWAAYKRMLEARYTQAFYESKETTVGSGRSAMSWEFIGSNYFTHGLPWGDEELEVNTRANAAQNEQYKTVYALDIEPQGRWLAAGSGEGTLSILDLHYHESGFDKSTCAPHGTLADGGSAILSLSLSNDGSRILTIGSDSIVRLLDRSTCDEIASAVTNTSNCTDFDIINFHQVKFDPYNNEQFFTATADVDQMLIRRWRISGNSFIKLNEITMTHMAILEGELPTNSCIGAGQLDVSQDGRYVVVSMHDSTARVWDLVQNSELILRLPGYTTSQLYSATLVSAVISADNSEILTSGYSRGGTRGLYRWQNRHDLVVNQQFVEENYEWLAPAGYRTLRYSHDYTRLVGLLHSFNVVDGAERASIYTVSPNNEIELKITGSRLSEDAKSAVLKPPFNDILITGPSSGSSFFPFWLEFRNGDEPPDSFFFEVTTPFIGHSAPIKRMTTSSSNTLALSASADKTAILWKTQLGTPIQRFEGHTRAIETAYFADNDTKVITASLDQTVQLWDLDGNVLQTFTGHNNEVTSAQANPAFTEIVSTAKNGELRIWNPSLPTTTNVVSSAHSGAANFAAYSPDGSFIASVGSDKTLKIWDAATIPPNLLRSYTHPHELNYVEFSPDGNRVAIADTFGKAHLVDANTAFHIAEFTHTACVTANSVCSAPEVNTAAFSKHDNGKQLLVSVDSFTLDSGHDAATTLKLFDADETSTTYGELKTTLNDGSALDDRKPLIGPSFSEDGDLILAGFHNGSNFDTHWIDFDSVWNANRSRSNLRSGKWALAGEQVNPYFMTPVSSTSPNICFLHEADELNRCGQECPCEFSCDQIPGGCTIYSTISTFRHQHLDSDSPIVESDFHPLQAVLNGFANSYFSGDFTQESLQALE